MNRFGWTTDPSIVFNGFDDVPIVTGDRVAFSVRDGNCAGLRVGTVLTVKHALHESSKRKYLGNGEWTEMFTTWYAEIKVRVKVTKASGYWGDHEYNTWVKPELMVRVPAPPPTRLLARGVVDPLDDSFMEPVL